ncbi:hypothetical protein [Streptomyces sp. V4I2]|uniref:hypothetical protein n=1 Tax=Streptomyces sp. V4I2 TaxID=3042280 RepID=UPI002785874A|nr:hypothetical protein [Streptomyces sp. V4I2]MDQ1047448.1 hypothetical protein [Streptomyces sp. V4I2]
MADKGDLVRVVARPRCRRGRTAPSCDGQDPTDFLNGMLVPPADYWPRVREVLDRHGILHTVGAAGYLTSRSPAIASPGPERKSSAARQM